MTPVPVRYEGRDLEAMSSAPNYRRWIAKTFAPFLKGRVLEVGAGSGTFSSLLLTYPLAELLMVEPSREMYPLLAERFRGNPRATTLQAQLPDISATHQNHFDFALYVNVLEHVADDRAELAHVRDSLAAGGAVGIFVPALPWLYSDYDRSVGHYRRYEKQQLRRLLEEAGFEVLSIRYFDVAGVLPWLLFIKLMKGQLSGGTVGLYDSLAVPTMSRIESLIPPLLGKNLIAVARKKL